LAKRPPREKGPPQCRRDDGDAKDFLRVVEEATNRANFQGENTVFCESASGEKRPADQKIIAAPVTSVARKSRISSRSQLSRFAMKFIPRQPQSSPEPSVPRATTTRFLRLQSTEEAQDDATEPVSATAALAIPRESRRLPPPREKSPDSPSATPSQRVRLRLDPEVATQPLPESSRPEVQRPLGETTVMPSTVQPFATSFVETPSLISDEILSVAPVAGPEEQADPVAPASEIVPRPEAAYEPPPQDAATAQPMPDATAPPSTVPIRPKLSWSQTTGHIPRTPSGAVKIRGGASSPISLSRMARGQRPATRRRVTPRAEKEDTASAVLPAPDTSAASDSQPLPRPELRLPTATPLAELSQPEPSLGRGFWILLVLLVLLFVAVLYFFGVVPKVTAFLAQRPQPHPAAAAERVVVYAVARRALTPVELPLSGTIEPFQQTELYARTTGYVRDWLVDIGDMVKSGQVLAELDTPDVDHQLTQARATADQAKAHLTLAQDESRRWDAMAAVHAVSQQDADEKDTARDEAQASFNAAQANVGRLVDMEVFKEIRAPYAGRITARNLEVGTLVAAGPGAADTELFRVAQTDPVRVFVEVPEASAPSIQAGLAAHIEVSSFPDRVFNGTVVRDAGILDSTTHRLRTELRVANPDGALLPGAQASVRLQLRDSASAVLIPAGTLIARGDRISVARLTETGGRDIVRFTPVKVGRDFGTEVEVLDSVREGDRLVAHPAPDLQDGTAVSARPMEETPLPSMLPPKPSAPRA
jgi:RND family efflux transporter MFP subunit